MNSVGLMLVVNLMATAKKHLFSIQHFLVSNRAAFRLKDNAPKREKRRLHLQANQE